MKSTIDIECENNNTTFYLYNPKMNEDLKFDKSIKENKATLIGQIMISRSKDLLHMSMEELQTEYVDQIKL